jgi:hypothetical protein
MWYIENCPATIHKDEPPAEICPACSYAQNQWMVHKQRKPESSMRRSYISNILVQEDFLQPETKNKVYIYRYGRIIFNKIKDYIESADHDPFDLEDGCSFILRQTQKEGFVNFDESHFDKRSYVCEPEEVENYMYDLSSVIDPFNFKTHEELTRRLRSVIS